MARAVSVLYLALAVLATPVVAQVPACPSGDKECVEKDDTESLLQHQHSVASGGDRTAFMTDKDASGLNASSTGFPFGFKGWWGSKKKKRGSKKKKKTGVLAKGWWESKPPRIPNEDGFYLADPRGSHQKCFLSKNSIFTVPPNKKTREWFLPPSSCRTLGDLKKIESQVVSAPPCISCRHELARMKPIDKWVDNCNECSNMWNRECRQNLQETRATQKWTGKMFADKVFSDGMQPFMIDLAKILSNHGISLYLDFADAGAERLVEHYGGRNLKDWPDELTFSMMELLAQRATPTNVRVVHWVGASKPFCEAELAGALRGNKEVKTLEFPPMFYTHEMTIPDVCWVRDWQKDKEPFAAKVCKLCGGQDCEKISVHHCS